MNILILDDDRTNADLLKMLLELDGFTVMLAPTLEAARTRLTAVTAALVVDCHLAGGVSGLTLVQEVRQGDTLAPSDLLIMAVSGDDRCVDKAQDAGADRFYLKPYSPNDFSANLKSLLS
jgi:DNA-binding response OmpR family regulator